MHEVIEALNAYRELCEAQGNAALISQAECAIAAFNRLPFHSHKPRKPRAAKQEREFLPVFAVKRDRDGNAISEREIDGVTVQKEIARVMRSFCASTRYTRPAEQFPQWDAGTEKREGMTTAEYVAMFDERARLVKAPYQGDLSRVPCQVEA